MKGALRFITANYTKETNVYCILFAAIILVIDYIIGKDIRFPILYVFPVGMAAWTKQKRTAYAMALLLPLARFCFHLSWHATEPLSVAAANAVIKIVALTLYAYLIDRSSRTRQLENRVRTLEGILPICASCKRIRNEKGEYEQIENYITKHSEASFSHGICSECAKKLYPHYFKDKDEL